MDEEEALSRLFNGAWAFLQKHVSVAAAALSRANGGAALLRLVHADIEVEAVRLLQSYLRAKDVPNHVKEAVKFVGVGPPEGGGAFGNASSGPDGGALGKASLAVSELAMGVGGASDGWAGPDGASSRFVAPAVGAGYEGGVDALVELAVHGLAGVQSDGRIGLFVHGHRWLYHLLLDESRATLDGAADCRGGRELAA